MRIVFLLCVMLTTSFINAPSVDAASDPGGFLGLKWSQSPADCKKLGLCSNDAITPEDKLASETIYKGKTVVIDGVDLRFSSFAFNNSKYYLGTAAFDSSATSYDTLKNALIAKHGKPTVVTSVASSWTIGSTRILLTNDKSTGSLMYANIPLFKEVAKLKKYPLPKVPAKK